MLAEKAYNILVHLTTERVLNIFKEIWFHYFRSYLHAGLGIVLFRYLDMIFFKAIRISGDKK